MAPENPSESKGQDLNPQPLPPIGSPIVLRALQLATEAFGTVEEPLGSNRGVDIDKWVAGLGNKFDYLLPKGKTKGVPWCGRFAAAMIDLAAKELDKTSPLKGAGDLASALKWKKWAKKEGKLVDLPAPGDIGLFLHDDGTGHVVMIADVKDGYVYTREGNASHGVRCRKHPIDGFQAFVRVE